MNTKDFKYLKSQIIQAEDNLNFYKKHIDMRNEQNFWKGYLNALNLIWLQAKNNYKL